MATYTEQDFIDAPAARLADGAIILRDPEGERYPWPVTPDTSVSDAVMVERGATPAFIVTTPQEGYEAAWDLAPKLPEDAMIPAGTPLTIRWDSGAMYVLPEGVSGETRAHGPHFERRLLNAPPAPRPRGAEQIQARIQKYLRTDFDPATVTETLPGLADEIAQGVGR